MLKTITALLSASVFFGCSTGLTKVKDTGPTFRPSMHSGYGERTVNIIIKTSPPDAVVYRARYDSDIRRFVTDEEIGTTPLTIPVVVDLRPSRMTVGASSLGAQQTSLYENTPPRFLFLVKKDGFFALFVWTTVSKMAFADDGDDISVDASPVQLCPDGTHFISQFNESLQREDYYTAERLRLDRLTALDLRQEYDRIWNEKSRSELNPFLVVPVGKVPARHTLRISTTSTSGKRLIQSEIEQLKHTVGILDPQLMAARKQLLEHIHAGDIESAIHLAEMVARIEERYFPKPPPPSPTIIVQSPSHADSTDKVIVEHKPQYGVTNLAEALINMRAGKVSPRDAQRAFGGAQMLDILIGSGALGSGDR